MSAPKFQHGRDFALAMDAQDPLAHFRQRFWIPKTKQGEESIYLCGHSLGLQPKTAASHVQQELKDWAELGVEGHFKEKTPWMPYHRLLTAQTAALVGANEGEVVVMNSLTVNLHLMMVSFYRPTKQRYKILIEHGAFPSDQYAVQSQIRFHGFDTQSALIEMRPRAGESCLDESEIESLIEREGDSIALVVLGGVNYATGQLFDLARITAAGHRHGCVVGFDLAHAAGNVPLRLHDSGADFAVWCSYKYLNGGPGCVAGCFVHERHAHSSDLPRFAGWWGHDEKTRFLMGPQFQPMPGAEGWQLSNPPILSLASLRASMDMFAEAGMQALREKSISLTGYLEFLLREKALYEGGSRLSASGVRKPRAGSRQAEAGSEFSIITPSSSGRRGAQLSIRIPHGGRALCDRLASEGVQCDWREPDTFRVAPVPLYNSYQDVYNFVERFGATLG